ncbi:MAG: transglutaminase-like cysteine peptidase [Candidatus Bathyarchaeota archaeon]|nr:transglutaminase-like cysteine peptidase [Candidatus Bathyarchaeota archaeon]MDH5788474.1 transglutaminase-like cysteine peptidase [Candidatus Bathyarchaeota archaeon]
MCLSRMREYWRMRHLARVQVIEQNKRPAPINVTTFFRPATVEALAADIVRSAFRNIGGSADCIFSWVQENIKLLPEPKDYWKMPSETLKDRTGDCEDAAILLANLLVAAGYPYYKVLVCVYDTPDGFHAVVDFDGRVLDPSNPKLTRAPLGWELWYCWNRNNAYTLKENVSKWQRP